MYLKLLQDGYIDAMYVSSGMCTEGKTLLQLAILPQVCDVCFDFIFNCGKTPKRMQQKFLH
jgi:hypothetical protein